MALLSRLRWPGLLALLVCSLACFWAAGSAWADAPPVYQPPGSVSEPAEPEGAPVCPGAPSGYEGASEAVAAVYGQQLLDVELCRVLVYQLARVSEREYWSAAQLFADDGEASDQRAEGLHLLTDLTELPAPSGSSAEVAEVTESGFLSLRYVLWFIAALLVGALGSYVLVRLVVFRDN